MEMDGTGQSGIVDETYNRLPTLLNDEGRTRGDTVVTNENGVASVGVDVLGELIDVDLVIVYWATGDRVRDGPIDSLALGDHEAKSPRKAYMAGVFTGGIGSGNW